MPIAPSAWPSSYASLATSWELGVGCVPYRRYDRCIWSASTLDETGRVKRAWCQVREGGCTGGPCPPVVDQN
eukprot:1142395-Prymnesium_polylepis.1